MVENCDTMLEILHKHKPFERIRDPENCDVRVIFFSRFFSWPRNYYNDNNSSSLPSWLTCFIDIASYFQSALLETVNLTPNFFFIPRVCPGGSLVLQTWQIVFSLPCSKTLNLTPNFIFQQSALLDHLLSEVADCLTLSNIVYLTPNFTAIPAIFSLVYPCTFSSAFLQLPI